jgi:hypothetical protein
VDHHTSGHAFENPPPQISSPSFEHLISIQPTWISQLFHIMYHDLSYTDMFELLSSPSSSPFAVCDGSVRSSERIFGWVRAISIPRFPPSDAVARPMALTWTPIFVEAYDLPLPAQMNIQSDLLAAIFQQASTHTTDQGPKIQGTGCHLLVENQFIPGYHHRKLRTKRSQRQLLLYIQQIHRLSDADVHTSIETATPGPSTPFNTKAIPSYLKF